MRACGWLGAEGRRIICEFITSYELVVTHATSRWMDSWPTLLPEPWTSIQEIHLLHLSCASDTFKDVDMYISFPNMTLLCLDSDGGTVLLPDLTDCERLKDVTLKSGWFSFPSNLEEKERQYNKIA